MAIKIIPQLQIQIPDPPPPKPTQFRAVEKNRDKEGGFAQTLAERFPFGLVEERAKELMEFNWGGERFDFRAYMLANNAKLLQFFEDHAEHQEKNRRLVERKLQSQIELAWFYFLIDHKQYLRGLQKKRWLADHTAYVQELFRRVAQRFHDRHHMFMRLKVAALVEDIEMRQFYDLKLKNNPHNDALKWHSQQSKANRQLQKKLDVLQVYAQLADAQRLEQQVLMDLKRNRLNQLFTMHDLTFAYMIQKEKTLVDPRPGLAAYAIRNVNKMRLNKVAPGTPPVKKVI